MRHHSERSKGSRHLESPTTASFGLIRGWPSEAQTRKTRRWNGWAQGFGGLHCAVCASLHACIFTRDCTELASESFTGSTKHSVGKGCPVCLRQGLYALTLPSNLAAGSYLVQDLGLTVHLLLSVPWTEPQRPGDCCDPAAKTMFQ